MQDPAAARNISEVSLPPRGRGTWLVPVVIFLLGLICYVPWLGSSPLSGTEGHRAITAHQIVQSREWLLPKLYGRVYVRKPPLHYWTLAAVEKITGVANEWVWRLPSAISGAALAAWLALVGGRWFGKPADWVSGASCLGLVALWSQNRSADIDAMNNLATVVAATCTIDIMWHEGCHRAFIIIGALAFAAMLLLKGPAGLPLVAGALMGGVLVTRNWRPLARPGIWVILIAGALLFAAWVIAALHEAKRQGISPDSGLNELAERLTVFNFKQFGRVLLLPLTALIYSLPISLALLLAFARNGPARMGPRRNITLAIVAAIATAALISILARTDNPRYVYVILPMFSLLAGPIAAAWQRGDFDVPTLMVLRALATGTAIALTGAGVALAASSWPKLDTRIYFLVLGIGSTLIGVFTVVAWMRRQVAAGSEGLIGLIVLLSLAFGLMKDADHRSRSAQPAAAVLRDALPRHVSVRAGAMVQDQPELFYYAGAAARWHGWGEFTPDRIPRGSWVVIHPTERGIWAPAMTNLTHITALPTREKGAFVAWYEPDAALQGAAATQPEK